MPTLTMELPDKVFAALRVGPDDFTREMRLAAAAAWYEQGEGKPGSCSKNSRAEPYRFPLGSCKNGQGFISNRF